MRYRIVYRVDGELEYMYREYMAQVGGIIRGIVSATDNWHVEVLGEDGEYHKLVVRQITSQAGRNHTVIENRLGVNDDLYYTQRVR